MKSQTFRKQVTTVTRTRESGGESKKICLRFFHAFIFECAKVWAIWKTTRPEQQTKVFHLVVKRSTRLRPQTKVLRLEFLKHET